MSIESETCRLAVMYLGTQFGAELFSNSLKRVFLLVTQQGQILKVSSLLHLISCTDGLEVRLTFEVQKQNKKPCQMCPSKSMMPYYIYVCLFFLIKYD